VSRGGPGTPLALPRTKDGRPILGRADLDAYDYAPTRSGGRERFFCPLHGGDHQRSLTLDPETGKFTCHTCGESGTLREFWPNQGGTVKTAKRTPAPSIEEIGRRELQAKARADAERAERLAAEIPDEASSFLATFNTMAVDLRRPECPGAAYLRERGLDPERAATLGVGYTAPGAWPGDRDRQVGRIAYPLGDPSTGRIVSAMGRLAVDASTQWSDEAVARFKAVKQRKLTGCPAGVWPVESLMAARGQRRPLVLVEGPADALTLLQHPAVPCAVVALAGTASVLPMESLKGVAGVILALDADDGGVKATRKLRVDLAVAGIAVEVMPPGWLGEGAKDAGELASAAASDKKGAAARYDQAIAALRDACNRLGCVVTPAPGMDTTPLPAGDDDGDWVTVDDAPAPVAAVSDFWRERLPFTCTMCGGHRRRLWSHDDGATWDDLCCDCSPLVIRNPDGGLWSEGRTIQPAEDDTDASVRACPSAHIERAPSVWEGETRAV